MKKIFNVVIFLSLYYCLVVSEAQRPFSFPNQPKPKSNISCSQDRHLEDTIKCECKSGVSFFVKEIICEGVILYTQYGQKIRVIFNFIEFLSLTTLHPQSIYCFGTDINHPYSKSTLPFAGLQHMKIIPQDSICFHVLIEILILFVQTFSMT